MQTDARLGIGRWALANALVIGLLFLVGIASFVLVADRLDNEFSAVARRDFKSTIALTHIGLLPAYLLVGLLHTFLSWPIATRLARRRATRSPAGWRPGLGRLFVTALVLNVLVFALSLGPITYLGHGSLDNLARVAASAGPSVNLYVFKTWHLQAVFTAVFAGLALLALRDAIAFGRARLAGRGPLARTAAVMGFGMILGAPFGWWWLEHAEPERQGPANGKPNILIVASDSLRADHFGFRGYRPRNGVAISPRIDEVAAEAVDFANMHVSAASTLESWTTMLSGLYPANHGLRYMFIDQPAAEAVAREENTLPRILHRAGYRSAVVGDWAANCFKLVDYGFDRTLTSDVQNLDVFLSEVAFRCHLLVTHYYSNRVGELMVPRMRQVTGYLNTGGLTDDLLDELDRASAAADPFFGVLFLACTHLPYIPTWPYNTQFTDPAYEGPNRFGLAFDVDDFIQHGFPEDLSAAERQQVIDLYDGGVAQFDHEVGRIVDHLKRTGLERNTVLIVTSDHGEDLYEPGTTLGHGTGFFGGDQSTRIPFLVRLPGAQYGGTKVAAVTRTVDVTPTVLEIAGVECPAGMDGVALGRSIDDPKHEPGLAAFAETCYLFYPKRVPDEEVYAMKPADRTLFIDPSFRNQFVLKPEYRDYVIETKDRMMRTKRWKLIYIKGVNGPIYRLYDMINDPDQRHDLSSEGLPIMDRMREALDRWTTTGHDVPWPVELDAMR